MSVSTNDLKNGMTLDLDGTLFQVVEFQHVKPGKGGAFVRTKLRNVKTARSSTRRSTRGSRSVSRSSSARRCSTSTRRVRPRVHGPADLRAAARARRRGRRRGYLTEGGQATVATHQGVPISVDLPASMVLAVTETDPAVKGDTRTNALKPATLETGVVVHVPLFVEEGDRVKVDTRSGDYIERVKA